jgi:hypothetical protein
MEDNRKEQERTELHRTIWRIAVGISGDDISFNRISSNNTTF